MKIDCIIESNVTNTSNVNRLKGLPEFYREVYTAFNECKILNNIDTIEILRQNIWFNLNFKYKEKILNYQNWYERGFHYVKDLMNNNGSGMVLNRPMKQLYYIKVKRKKLPQ